MVNEHKPNYPPLGKPAERTTFPFSWLCPAKISGAKQGIAGGWQQTSAHASPRGPLRISPISYTSSI
ncbi:MAG: hypothetical protein CSA97_05830 [Bacteroidetes bacterium]|nr:MAG: hypothetical protein CSA97_05830 [Bacteroidota bacterium]